MIDRKPNYLPLDVCELVPDQHVRKNLTSDQTAEMIKASTSQTPRERLEMIKDSAKNILNDSKPFMQEFNVQYFNAGQPLRIDGRVLDAPEIKYSMDRVVKPFDGKWDMKYEKFFQPATLKNWIIVCFSQDDRKLSQFESEIIRCGERLGMKINAPVRRVKIANCRQETISKIFVKAKEVCGGSVDMIVFILTPRIEHLYEAIKMSGDVEHGIVTQCIKESNLNNIKYTLIHCYFHTVYVFSFFDMIFSLFV